MDKIDPNEAPCGYFAAPKPSAENGNICRQCDWRAECQKPDADFTISTNRCMSYAIVTGEGLTVQRNDKQSVIFKRLSGV